MATRERRRKVAAQTGLYLVVVTAIVIVANMISAGAYARIDETKNERYTLSKGSERLIKGLKTPVEVDAYVKKDTGIAQLDAFVSDLTDLLKEYEDSTDGKFKFKVIDPKTDEEREKAQEAGLQEQPFAAPTGGDRATITQGYLGLVFKYGLEKGVIPLNPNQTEGLEFWITNKIRELKNKNDDITLKVGVIGGKDELKLSDKNLVARGGQGQAPTLEAILQQAFPFYKIEELDLKGGEEAIDPEFVGVIITQPRKDYTEEELKAIDNFLMLGGKSLAVFASAVTMKPNDPSMSAELSLHGLDPLLSGYGISMKQNAVLDYGAQFRLPVMAMGGMQWITHPGIAHVRSYPGLEDDEKLLDTSFAPFFRLDQVMMPYPSSLELLRDKQPEDVELKAVARTTENASVVAGDSVDMKMREEWDPKPPYEQRVIAAAADGKLKSAFGDKRAPEASRVLVVSSSQFLTNPFAYAGNGPELGGQFQMFGGVGGDKNLQMMAGPYAQQYITGMILSLKNTLDWMSGDADLVATSAKLMGNPSLVYSDISKDTPGPEATEEQIRKWEENAQKERERTQKEVQWTLTLGVPFLFGGFGLFRWRRREAERGKKG